MAARHNSVNWVLRSGSLNISMMCAFFAIDLLLPSTHHHQLTNCLINISTECYPDLDIMQQQISFIVGLAIIGGVVLYLQGKYGAKSAAGKKRATKTSTKSAPVSPPRPKINKNEVGSVHTPAGRRSARLARKAD